MTDLEKANRVIEIQHMNIQCLEAKLAKPDTTVNGTAEAFLIKASTLMAQRGKDYDKDKERSADKTATAFNAITGYNLKASDVWLILQVLKDVRQHSSPTYHSDSAEDGVAYSALKAEALRAESK